MDEERQKEAHVHFKFYGLLCNNIYKCSSNAIHYVSVEPEYSVKGGSADLVIIAEIDGNIQPFLTIEVKKPTKRGYLLLDSSSQKQLEGYVEVLKTEFSVLIDGHYLRLFRNNNPISDCEFQILGEKADEYVISFLKELCELHDEKRETLSFTPINFNKLEHELDALETSLKEVFDYLAQKPGFNLEPEEKEQTRMKKLTVGPYKKLMRLGIDRLGADSSFIDIRLEELRKRIDPNQLNAILNDLKKIPGFQWVCMDAAKENTWHNLGEINIEEDQLQDMKDGLIKWLESLKDTAIN